MKNYVGISRDHSASMWPHAHLALIDYNQTIEGIRQAAEGIDTVVSVVRCGVGYNATVEREVVNSSIAALKPLVRYEADGHGTPLLDSMGELLDILEAAPDCSHPLVTFLVVGETDGLENASRLVTPQALRERILRLQATDRWTFVFRVPVGYKKRLSQLLGIPAGNILEWQQTERGFQEATQATTAGIGDYFRGLRSGKLSSDRFFTNAAGIKISTVKKRLADISSQVFIWVVDPGDPTSIRDFCDQRLTSFFKVGLTGPKSYTKGCAFYELVKPETVQSYKKIAVRDKRTGAVYSGHEVRGLLGLPEVGSIRLVPGDHGRYDIFIQSTSVNRKLSVGSKLLYLNIS